jgi:hypothetical protein
MVAKVDEDARNNARRARRRRAKVKASERHTSKHTTSGPNWVVSSRLPLVISISLFVFAVFINFRPFRSLPELPLAKAQIERNPTNRTHSKKSSGSIDRIQKSTD